MFPGKTTLVFLKTALIWASIFLTAVFDLNAQAYEPIPVRGFNQDVIAEGNGRSALQKTSLEMDFIDPSNFVMFSKQFAKANMLPAEYGLPDNGIISKRSIQFNLNRYTDKNALYLFPNQSGRLSLLTPKNFATISLLGLATEGDAVINVELKFTDSTSQKFNGMIFPDWFDGMQPFILGFGRIKRSNGSDASPLYFEGAPSNPRMYTIELNNIHNKTLAYVVVKNNSLGSSQQTHRAFVFALAGFVHKPTEEKVIIKQEEIIPEKKEIQPSLASKTFVLEGQVLDMKTSQPLQLKLNFIGSSTYSATTDINGAYRIEFPEKSEYKVKAETPGYMNLMESLNLNMINSHKQDFKMIPIEVGTLVKLNSIHFEQSSPKLKEESFPELDQTVEFLKNNPTVKIHLAGHTDNRGPKKLNLKLSEERVKTVKNYIVNKGIDSNRITGKGYGSSKPLIKEDNEEAWRQNRRVEFTIISK